MKTSLSRLRSLRPFHCANPQLRGPSQYTALWLATLVTPSTALSKAVQVDGPQRSGEVLISLRQCRLYFHYHNVGSQRDSYPLHRSTDLAPSLRIEVPWNPTHWHTVVHTPLLMEVCSFCRACIFNYCAAQLGFAVLVLFCLFSCSKVVRPLQVDGCLIRTEYSDYQS